MLLVCLQLLILSTTPHSSTGLNIHLVYPDSSSLRSGHICFLTHLLLKLIRQHHPLPPYSQAYPKALFYVHIFLFFLSHRLQMSLILARPVKIAFLSINMLTTPSFIHIGANSSSSLVSQIASIESCMRVHDWLLNHGLHLSPSKSEAITFFNPRSKPLQSLAESIGSISVVGLLIKLQTSIKNLDVYLDSRQTGI